MNPINLPNFRILPGMLARTTGRKIPFRIGAQRTVGRGQAKQTQVYLVHPRHGAGWWAPIGDVTGIVASDLATGGCLVQILGDGADGVWYNLLDGRWCARTSDGYRSFPTLGEACVAVAVAFGRWPG